MPSIARPDAIAENSLSANLSVLAAGKVRAVGAGATSAPNCAIAASETDFVLSVCVTHAEVDNYARRLRERCDRTLAAGRG